MAVLEWPDKDPEEELDYPMDFTPWVVSGFNIDSSACVIESETPTGGATPLSIDLVSHAANVVTVWLSGGTDGITYTLKVTVTDDNVTPNDRQGVRRVRIKVKKK